MAETSDVPVAEPAAADQFGPPHAHAVSDTLQMWILVPGLLAILFGGEPRRVCVRVYIQERESYCCR